MCGIAGIYNLHRDGEVPLDVLRAMTAVVRHRGPDGCGYYRDEKIGLAHTRLSIIDPAGGGQPLHNEDKTIWITFNGEVFNYLELRDELRKRGHVFHTESDTEVVIHLYEEEGPDCVHRLNGQFAFGIWDRNAGELLLARDRVGIRPLFYTFAGGQLLFASEIKSLFMDRRVRRQIDPRAIDQICTFWTTVPPQTAFRDVFELPAGHRLRARSGAVRIERYWEPGFGHTPGGKTEDEYAEQLLALLADATKLQLRADVPVGAYLSGGIDSSAVAALAKRYADPSPRTFSVAFTDERFDESAYQRQMAEHLGVRHSSVTCAHADIGAAFPDVIWHTEKPVVRTAPAPLYLLSRLVQESGYKVVLTGEGADEILAGYDVFKEVKARRFLERAPRSSWRPLILKRLYPYLAASPVRSLAYAEAFLTANGSGYAEAYSSHVPRWNTTAKIKTFFSVQMQQDLAGHDSIDDLSLFLGPQPAHSDRLSQAQYLETKTLLPGYLLSSQGDRMAMAHSVECRHPFLDHRVIEFCGALPPTMKMRALTEKYLLKKSMHRLLPPAILRRQKQPYRAPDAASFFHPAAPEYVSSLLAPENLADTGYFDPNKVAVLIKKCARNPLLGFKDNMAAVGIVSTLLLHELFIKDFEKRTNGIVEQTAGLQGAYAHKA